MKCNKTLFLILAFSSTVYAETLPIPANPCAAKKIANPCAVEVVKLNFMRPKGTKLMVGDTKEIIELGKKLWNDNKLSSNGMACNTCHNNGASFKASFAEPYPHKINMIGATKEVHLDEMVQFCLLKPMATKPFAWDSKELAALTAYTAEMQKEFIKK
jgi:cytochrome c peroxidase